MIGKAGATLPIGRLLIVFLAALPFASAQSLIIPQIADGGGWQTTLVLTNTSASATTASLNFFQSTSGGGTESWTPPFLETSSTQNLPVPGAGTLFLHTPGTAGALSEGWGQVQASSAVVAYAIFTQTVPGQLSQDGTAPAVAASSRVLMPFDNTNGLVTSMAIVNPTAASESIAVGMQPLSANPSQLTAITLPANGYMAFALPQQFSAAAAQRGLLEFYSASGSISVIALRFSPTGGFTTAPVYAESGPPIIVGGSSLATFDGSYTGSYNSSGGVFNGTISASVSNGVVTVTHPGSGTGTITPAGQITFGVDITGGATCNFTGTIALTGTAAAGSGTYSCTSPSITGTWNVTRQ
jgi:hypothetical protein